MKENESLNSHPYFPLDDAMQIRYIKLTSFSEAPGEGKFAVSGIRAFGDSFGDKPSVAPQAKASRLEDATRIAVYWDKVDGAQGYVVRLGVDPDEMHIHYTVFGECELEIGCLISGVKYHLTVDSFSEGGLTRGSEIIEIE